MFAKKARVDQRLHLDESILSEIWEALWVHQEIRCLDIDDFSVSVNKSVVRMWGHLHRENNLQLIEMVVRGVPGVLAVENSLVCDRDLTMQVANALARDDRTRLFVLAVGTNHGWVNLGGEVPTGELQTIAEEVAAQVPSVRGIVSLPNVAGETSNPIRHAVQPRINTPLYGDNGQIGEISQVVIEPRNRLVTHVVVVNDGPEKYLVTVEALEVVNKESTFLKHQPACLGVFPIFNSSTFSPAPTNWQPPYPYTVEAVLWPAKEDPQIPLIAVRVEGERN